MRKNHDLQKQARPGEKAIRADISKPDITTQPERPAKADLDRRFELQEEFGSPAAATEVDENAELDR